MWDKDKLCQKKKKEGDQFYVFTNRKIEKGF